MRMGHPRWCSPGRGVTGRTYFMLAPTAGGRPATSCRRGPQPGHYQLGTNAPLAFRDRRPPARNGWTTDRPMRPGRTTRLVTHIAACTTGPVSHADRIHPSEPGNVSFLAMAAAAPFRFAHSAARPGSDQTELGVPALGAPSAVGLVG